MTEWTTHIPAFDGDAPEGVGLDTHFIMYLRNDGVWANDDGTRWYRGWRYSYAPRRKTPPATYAQVKAYCEQHGLPVPPKPTDYEAWADVMDRASMMWVRKSRDFDDDDKEQIHAFIGAVKYAMTIPACMEDVKG